MHDAASCLNTENKLPEARYNEDDYLDVLHPFIVGIGFDAVAANGFYLDGDTTSHGASIALDDFGGHEHDDYGYHYTSNQTSERNNACVLDELAPLGARVGRINNVPEFQERINRSIWPRNP